MTSLLSLHRGAASRAAIEHLETGGKRLRAKLALHSATRLSLSAGAAIGIAAAGELIHNASLIHDDIQDRSPTRRGEATLWARYGHDLSICAGDLMVSAAYGALAKVSGPHLAALIGRLHLRVSEVISGQSADLSARGRSVETQQEYRRIAAGKSAPLLALPIELSLIAAGRADALSQVEAAADAFATAYQMADDIEDAHIDIPNGEMNIISVLAREAPLDSSRVIAQSLVVRDYRLASDLARGLPLGCGALMADLAEEFLRRTQPQSIPA
jgi:geranylgeranyl diphosphate synthase type II